MMKHTILIVDDDIAITTSLKLLLKQAGFLSLVAFQPDEAEKQMAENQIDLIILDMNFSRSTSGDEGLGFLQIVKKRNPEIPVILITAWASIPLAVKGMKLGASDFIHKPWNNDQLLNSIKTQLSLSTGLLSEQTDMNREQLNRSFDFANIIGDDPEFLKILQTVGRICKTDASVLITGESGTGKEAIAQAIHENSRRKNNPFIKVNLGGISSTLFESEMFGHKKGAFTDAKTDRQGRFEAADKGTIFLDEIGDLDPNCQVKLLRILEDRKFEVLGSSKTQAVDVRIISATNRNLEKMVEDHQFREDLYYRINLITLSLPPLRKRPGDIPLLVEKYLNNIKKIYGREHLEVTHNAIDWLKKQPWPGNVRELKNLVERTVLVSGKDILETEDFSSQFYDSPQKGEQDGLPAVGSMTLEEIEESMIRKSLQFHEHNISKVAQSLGLSRGALYRRMEKYGIVE
jgi:DNA-binding NtrC family response regulator